MGVTQLWQILSPVQQHKTLAELEGLTLAVDLSIWVVETQGVRQMQGVVAKPFLRNLFFRISHLTQLGVKLVFVIEGTAPELKWEVMMKRQQSRFPGRQGKQVAQRPAGKQTRKHFNSCLKECCELLDILGIPYIQSRGEAEAMCALLNKAGLVDGCLTNDGDAFLFGAETVYRNFTMNAKDPHVEMYRLCDMKSQLSLDRDGLVALGLLLGCDYVPGGVPGIGLANAVKLLQTLAGRNMLHRIQEWRKIKEDDCLDHVEVLARRKAVAVSDFPQSKVINEFKVMKDRCPTQLPPWRRPVPTKLQEFVLVKLEWPPEYTLDKVLPLITLWDMQDILRSNNPSRHQHLKPYRIVKTRVRQGVQCYEVEWHKPVTDTLFDGNYYTTIESQELFAKCFPDVVDEFTIKSLETKKKPKSKSKKKKKPVDVAANLENLSFHFEKMNLNSLTNKLQKSIHDLHPSFTDYDENLLTPKIRQSKVHPSQAVPVPQLASESAPQPASLPKTSTLSNIEVSELNVKPLDRNFFSDSVSKAIGYTARHEVNKADLLLSQDSYDNSDCDDYMPLMKRMENRLRNKKSVTERSGPNDDRGSCPISQASVNANVFENFNLFEHIGAGDSPVSYGQQHLTGLATPRSSVQTPFDDHHMGLGGHYSDTNVTKCQCGAQKDPPSVKGTNAATVNGNKAHMVADTPGLSKPPAMLKHNRLSEIGVMNSPLLHSGSNSPVSHMASTPIRESVELDCMSSSGFGDYNIQSSLLTSLCSSLIQALTPKGIGKDEYHNLVSSLQKLDLSQNDRICAKDHQNDVKCNIDFKQVETTSDPLKEPLKLTAPKKLITSEKGKGKKVKTEPGKITRTALRKLRKQQKLEEQAMLNESKHSKHHTTPSSKHAANQSHQNLSNRKSKKQKSNGNTCKNTVDGKPADVAASKQHAKPPTSKLVNNGNLSTVSNDKMGVQHVNRQSNNRSESKDNKVSVDKKSRTKGGKKLMSSLTGSPQPIDKCQKQAQNISVGNKNSGIETSNKTERKHCSRNNSGHGATVKENPIDPRNTYEVMDSIKDADTDVASVPITESQGKTKKKKKRKKVKKSVADFDLSQDDSFFVDTQRKQCAEFLKKAILSEKSGSSHVKIEKASPVIDLSADDTLLELDVISGSLTGLTAETNMKARLKRKLKLEAMQKSSAVKIESDTNSCCKDEAEKYNDGNAKCVAQSKDNVLEIKKSATENKGTSPCKQPMVNTAAVSGVACKSNNDHQPNNVESEDATASNNAGSPDRRSTVNDSLNESAIKVIQERAWKLIEERLLTQAKKMVSTCGTQTMEESAISESNKAQVEALQIQDDSAFIDQLAESVEASMDSSAMAEFAKLLIPGHSSIVEEPVDDNIESQLSHKGSSVSDVTESRSKKVASIGTDSILNVVEESGPLGAKSTENMKTDVKGSSEPNGAELSMNMSVDSVKINSESFLDNSLDISCPFNKALKQYMGTNVSPDHSVRRSSVDSAKAHTQTKSGQCSEHVNDGCDSEINSAFHNAENIDQQEDHGAIADQEHKTYSRICYEDKEKSCEGNGYVDNGCGFERKHNADEDVEVIEEDERELGDEMVQIADKAWKPCGDSESIVDDSESSNAGTIVSGDFNGQGNRPNAMRGESYVYVDEGENGCIAKDHTACEDDGGVNVPDPDRMDNGTEAHNMKEIADENDTDIAQKEIDSDVTDVADIIMIEDECAEEVKSNDGLLKNGIGGATGLNLFGLNEGTEHVNVYHNKVREDSCCMNNGVSEKADGTTTGSRNGNYNLSDNLELVSPNGQTVATELPKQSYGEMKKENGKNENNLVTMIDDSKYEPTQMNGHSENKIYDDDCEGQQVMQENNREHPLNVADDDCEGQQEMKTNGEHPLNVADVKMMAEETAASSPVCLADRLKLRLRKTTTRSVLDSLLNGLK